MDLNISVGDELRRKHADLGLDDSWMAHVPMQLRSQARLAARIERAWRAQFELYTEDSSVARRNMHVRTDDQLRSVENLAIGWANMFDSEHSSNLAHTARVAAANHNRAANDIWVDADLHDRAWHASPWNAQHIAGRVINNPFARQTWKEQLEAVLHTGGPPKPTRPGEIETIGSFDELVEAFMATTAEPSGQRHNHRDLCEATAQAALDIEQAWRDTHVVAWHPPAHWWSTRRPGLYSHVSGWRDGAECVVLYTADPELWAVPVSSGITMSVRDDDEMAEKATLVELGQDATHDTLTKIAQVYQALPATTASLEAAVAFAQPTPVD